MTVTYRVLVVRERTARRGLLNFEGVELPAEVLFETAGPDAERLLGYAPDEVEQALKAAADATPEPARAPLVDIEALASGGTIRATEPPAQAVDAPAEQAPADDKPKRTRRTKAEIAAAKAAEALAATGVAPAVAEQVVADSSAVGVTVSTSFEGAAPVPAAVPYNPFA